MFTFILAVMMIPTQVTALGFLQLPGKIGLDDSFVPLIVPSVAAPVTFFYMKQYMESNLPLELVETARIDGSGEFNTFNKIVFLLMKPAIAVQAIFTFVQSWNNYFIPALVLHSDKKKTLPGHHCLHSSFQIHCRRCFRRCGQGLNTKSCLFRMQIPPEARLTTLGSDPGIQEVKNLGINKSSILAILHNIQF